MTKEPLELLKSAPPATRPVIALSEGNDPRVIAGALAAVQAGVTDVILVGAAEEVRAQLVAQNAAENDRVQIHDPVTSPLSEGLASAFHAVRKHKGQTEDAARKAVRTPLVYGAMLVREGHAAGTVGGAVHTTSDVVRAALQVIGKAPDAPIVSSFFLMYPPVNAPEGARAMLYADCGLVIDPSAEDLVAIAAASAVSCRALMRVEPKIAMLSFSSKGSARHAKVSKVANAVAMLNDQYPEVQVDGELQFDAAFVPAVGASKAPGSDVAGQANVMIFPNLDAGNISYKITQRLGGYTAIGPILQGLAKPVNDLSRGCAAEDVAQMIAVTILQANTG